MYKLNQIEGALNALTSGKPRTALQRAGQPVPQVLKTRIKRLVEIDRERMRSASGAGVAFFDVLPEGKGSDAQYDMFGAFCLAIGLEMLRFGFKQREVVGKIASVRDLLREFYRSRMGKVSVEGGTYVVTDLDGTLPRKRAGRNQDKDSADYRGFLVLDALEGADVVDQSYDRDFGSRPQFCIGEEVLLRTLGRIIPTERYGVFVIEISELMFRLREVLDAQPVRRRGRGPR